MGQWYENMTKYQRSKETFLSLFDSFAMLLLGPVLFAFVIFLLFTRIKTIIDYTTAVPEYSFWKIFNLDMAQNPLLYIVFFTVAVLWMIAKVRHYNQQVREHKELVSLQKELIYITKDMHKDIKGIQNKFVDKEK